jgi:hypothetical protein
LAPLLLASAGIDVTRVHLHWHIGVLGGSVANRLAEESSPYWVSIVIHCLREWACPTGSSLRRLLSFATTSNNAVMQAMMLSKSSLASAR